MTNAHFLSSIYGFETKMTTMDQTNNIVNAQNLNHEDQEIKNNDTLPNVKEEIVMGGREVVKIYDDAENGVFGLDYERETEEIVALIVGATKGNPVVVEDLEDDDDVVVTKIMSRGECSSGGSGSRVVIDIDDDFGDYPDVFVCEICTESLPVDDKFWIEGCGHFYCSMCVSQYIGSKIEENVTRIICPVSGCCGTLEAQNCRRILPKKVFDRWGDVLCEEVIAATQKFYCPFKDCSALLIDDGGGGGLGGEVIRASECPNCWRLFCAQCKVPWHMEVSCADFQKLSSGEREREDILLMNLAKRKEWKRCPKCKFYVERISGCLFMRCRCGHGFCYTCGASLKEHFCHVCKR